VKVALIIPNNSFKAPYLQNYKGILADHGIDFYVIAWNRSNRDEPEVISFNRSPSSFPYLKFWDFLLFSKFVKKVLQDGQYNRVIIFSIQLSIFLFPYLRKTRLPFVLDIRDYSPLVPYFRKRLSRIVEAASFTVLSSTGFQKWLPKNPSYVLNHNVNKNLLCNVGEGNINPKGYFNQDKIRIDTIGQIRDFQTNASFIRALNDRDKFVIRFIGHGPASEALRELVNEQGIGNVEFSGPYRKEEEGNLLEKADFLNILVDRENINGATLLTNRLYLSALYGIPCIVFKNTAQSEFVEKYKLGIIVDNLGNLADQIIDYKNSFDRDQFLEGCSAFLGKVSKENQHFESKLLQFVSIQS
jgi:hypothetical protein